MVLSRRKQVLHGIVSPLFYVSQAVYFSVPLSINHLPKKFARRSYTVLSSALFNVLTANDVSKMV